MFDFGFVNLFMKALWTQIRKYGDPRRDFDRYPRTWSSKRSQIDYGQ